MKPKLFTGLATALMGLAVQGCEQTTGVLPMGRDTYSISASAEIGGVVRAKKIAITEAHAFCTQRGRQVMPVTTRSSVKPDFVGDPIGHYDFTFRCLREDDPEYRRPNLQSVPDTVIEDRRAR